MGRDKRRQATGRSSSGRFVALPYQVLYHPNYIGLPARARMLLVDLLLQFNGNNNGDLAATMSMMTKRGWKSEATLRLAIKDLLAAGMIIESRGGGKHKARLFAVTFHGVDECKGKLDIKASTAPPGDWRKKLDPVPQKLRQCSPETGAINDSGAPF